MDDRWIARLSTELDARHPTVDLWERARQLEPTRVAAEPFAAQRLGAGVVALAVMGVVVYGAWALLGEGDGTPGAGSEEPVSRLGVVCEGGETKLDARMVLRRGGRVHFHLENRDGAEGLFVRDVRDPLRSWARGALGEKDVAEFMLPVPSGEMEVLCLHPPVNTLEVPEDRFEPLTVIEEVTADALTAVRPYEDEVLEAGWVATQQEVRERLDAWATEVGVHDMTTEELAAAMDVITSAASSTKSLEWLQLRELLARRDLLCRRLPANHIHRGGEYCD